MLVLYIFYLFTDIGNLSSAYFNLIKDFKFEC